MKNIFTIIALALAVAFGATIAKADGVTGADTGYNNDKDFSGKDLNKGESGGDNGGDGN